MSSDYQRGIERFAVHFYKRFQERPEPRPRLGQVDEITRAASDDVLREMGNEPTFDMAVRVAKMLGDSKIAPESYAGEMFGLFLLQRLRAFQAIAGDTAPKMEIRILLDIVRQGKLPEGFVAVRIHKGGEVLH